MKWTAPKIKQLKGKEKIACLTAGDYSTARLLDAAGMHMILVGDSLAMTLLGFESTLPVSMEQMLHHTQAVVRGVASSLVVADMPFMSYQESDAQALHNAGLFLKQGGAGAVKVEGGGIRKSCVECLTQNGIPVLGHIGLTPQSIHAMGGFKVQGKLPKEAEALLKDAEILAKAGAFALVLECIPRDLGDAITDSIDIPTLGIGAGPGCDGQVIVTHDMLGIDTSVSPSFVKRYAEVGKNMMEAFSRFKNEINSGQFPSEEHCFPKQR